MCAERKDCVKLQAGGRDSLPSLSSSVPISKNSITKCRLPPPPVSFLGQVPPENILAGMGLSNQLRDRGGIVHLPLIAMETEWQATGSMNLGLLANHWSSRTEEGAGCQARLNLRKELEGRKGGGELMLSYQLSTVGTRAKTLGLFQSGALGYEVGSC